MFLTIYWTTNKSWYSTRELLTKACRKSYGNFIRSIVRTTKTINNSRIRGHCWQWCPGMIHCLTKHLKIVQDNYMISLYPLSSLTRRPPAFLTITLKCSVDFPRLLPENVLKINKSKDKNDKRHQMANIRASQCHRACPGSQLQNHGFFSVGALCLEAGVQNNISIVDEVMSYCVSGEDEPKPVGSWLAMQSRADARTTI